MPETAIQRQIANSRRKRAIVILETIAGICFALGPIFRVGSNWYGTKLLNSTLLIGLAAISQ